MNWSKAAKYLESLYDAVDGLEELFPGRKFTLDGHLVGSIGEVVAAYMFDLKLNPASTEGSDAKTKDGICVEIKLTQGKKIGLRSAPEHLIVLQKERGSEIIVAYNGPGNLAWNASGKMQKNGQRALSISKLTKLDAMILPTARIKLINSSPI